MHNQLIQLTQRQLQAGIRGFPILASILSAQYKVPVRIGGNRAYANRQGITLPGVPLDGPPILYYLALWKLAHECGHVRFSCWDTLEAAHLTKLTHFLSNLAEDPRVNEEMVRFYPGCQDSFLSMYEYAISQNPPIDPAEPGANLIGWLMDAVFQKFYPTLAFKEEEYRVVVETAFPGLVDELQPIVDRVQRCSSTADSIAWARDVEACLSNYLERAKEEKETSQSDDAQPQSGESGDDTDASESADPDSQGGDSGGAGDGSGGSSGNGKDDEKSSSGESPAGPDGRGGADGNDESEPGGDPEQAPDGAAEDGSTSGEDESVDQNGENGADAGPDGNEQVGDDNAGSSNGNQPESDDSAAGTEGGKPDGSGTVDDSSDGGDKTENAPGGNHQGDTETVSGQAEPAKDGMEQGETNSDSSHQEDGGQPGMAEGNQGTEEDDAAMLDVDSGGADALDVLDAMLNGTKQALPSEESLVALIKLLSSEEELPDDVGEILAKILVQAAHNCPRDQILQVALVKDDVIKCMPEKLLADAKTATVALSARLSGLLQAMTLTRQHIGRRGKLTPQKLHRIAVQNPRVFEKNVDKYEIDTCVQVLLDCSSSMAEDIELANSACYAVASALYPIRSLKVGVAAFPSVQTWEEMNTVNPILQPGQRIHTRFAAASRGSTPMGEALWWACQKLVLLQEERKIILVLTDGEPDSEPNVRAALEIARKLGIEVLGIGIGKEAEYITELIEGSKVILNIQELAPAMFSVLQRALTARRCQTRR